jgi:hypothetical protein
MTEAITLIITACLVSLLRKLLPSIDGPARVGAALVAAGMAVTLGTEYGPALLAMLPPVVGTVGKVLLGAFVAMGGVELLRSFASKVDIDQRTMAAARQSTTYDVAINTREAEAALDKLGAKARETAQAVAAVGVVTSREP